MQQLNCLGLEGAGLARLIAEKLPYGCSYKMRRADPWRKQEPRIAILEDRPTPGTIDVRRPMVGGDRPAVINLFAQYAPGRPGSCAQVPFPSGVTDSAKQRLFWFEQCLNVIGTLPPEVRPERLVFPAQIGCGLAGGSWPDYEAAIQRFVAAHAGFVVCIVGPGGPGELATVETPAHWKSPSDVSAPAESCADLVAELGEYDRPLHAVQVEDAWARMAARLVGGVLQEPVSYTHLTLPTIYSV